jgi:hypothetical protein
VKPFGGRRVALRADFSARSALIVAASNRLSAVKKF